MSKANELITGLLSEPLEETNDALQHWGIFGMKWGIRRFQNKDGSLTPEGKLRYAREQEKKDLKWRLKKEKSENSFGLRRLRAKLSKQIKKHKLNTPTEIYTDDELKALRWRLGLEKDVKELNGQADAERDERYNSARNKEFFRRIGETTVDTGKNLLTSAGRIAETNARTTEAFVSGGFGIGQKLVGIGENHQSQRYRRENRAEDAEKREREREKEAAQRQHDESAVLLERAKFNTRRMEYIDDIWRTEHGQKPRNRDKK